MVLIEHYTPARAGRATRAAAIPEYHALRVKDFSYVEYAPGERKLYDLGRDPYQLQNIYNSADQNLVSVLSARLTALKQCAGETCRAAEDATLPTVR